MTNIPDDIMDRASRVSETACKGFSKKASEHLALAMALLMLSERRRCAVIARQWKETPHKSEQYAANTIADRIMAGDAA